MCTNVSEWFLKGFLRKCVLSRIGGKKLKGRNLLALWKLINCGLKITIGANYTFISSYELNVAAPEINVTSSVNGWAKCEDHLLGTELEKAYVNSLWHILQLSWRYFQEDILASYWNKIHCAKIKESTLSGFSLTTNAEFNFYLQEL